MENQQWTSETVLVIRTITKKLSILGLVSIFIIVDETYKRKNTIN